MDSLNYDKRAANRRIILLETLEVLQCVVFQNAFRWEELLNVKKKRIK